jgi:hypothetical protein
MTILELSRLSSASPMSPYSPFTYWSRPALRTTATYWTTTFGAPDESVASSTVISSIIENPATKYQQVSSISACEAVERSFFWDNGNQLLYMHITHTTEPDDDNFGFGSAFGYSDKDVVYIDRQEYLPYVRSVPSIAQKADLVSYDRLAFVSGSVELDNTDGHFDDIIDLPIYGNDLNIYYLPEIKNPTRGDLIQLASFYVEDYNFSLSKFSLAVQDKRKAQNSKILKLRTPQGVEVPLIYGQVNRAKALVNEAEGTTGATVAYRVAEVLTNLGTVQVDLDGTWTTRATANVDLATGSFTLSATNGRRGGVNTGAPLPCRVLSPIGIANTTVADVIVSLNQRILGIPYTDDFYDTAEWAIESATLSPASVVFDKNIELFEAIRRLQNGVNKGFRYEINPTGKRTLRVDDWSRMPLMSAFWSPDGFDIFATEDDSPIYVNVPRTDITVIDIKDSKNLPVATDSAIFATSVTVAYAKDWNQGSFSRTTNTDFEAVAFEKYRQNPNLEIDSLLLTLSDAQARALWSAERLSEIRPILICELHGQEYYDVRIYDMLHIDLSSQSRVYFGKWQAQVIGIDPRFDGLTNRITAVLIGRI